MSCEHVKPERDKEARKELRGSEGRPVRKCGRKGVRKKAVARSKRKYRKVNCVKRYEAVKEG